jgi:hypothetical protein
MSVGPFAPASPAAQPPLKALAAELGQITEILAAQLHRSAAVPPHWSAVQWEIARAAATLHGIAPLLSVRLAWHGPAGWEQFLRQQREQVAQRQRRIEALLERLHASARAAGVPVLLLKGAALHRMGYCEPGLRPMGDVDLLVRPQHLATLDPILCCLGYREAARSWRHRVYEPLEGNFDPGFGEHAAAPVRIEVHSKVAERLPWTEADITSRLLDGVDDSGLHHYCTVAAMLQHQLLHAAGNMSSRWLRLLQLHDLQRIATSMSDAQWQQWLQLAESERTLWWANPPLMLTARYFPAAIPAFVLQAAGCHGTRLLRTIAARYSLTAVSGSSLWVSGAPAWAWAQSPVELAVYVLRRLIPATSEMAYNSRTARSLSWHRAGNWYSLPQAVRIFQWLVRRPARPQILHALRLAQQGSAGPLSAA